MGKREREKERRRAGCFTLTVFLMSCDSQCSVVLPHGALGWTAVCDCGILIILTCLFHSSENVIEVQEN